MVGRQRERLILILLIVAIAALAVDRMALEPYMTYRNELQSEREANAQAIRDNQSLLEQEQKLQQRHVHGSMRLATDAASAENQLLHLLHQWETDANIHNASFQRMQTHPEGGFDLLTYRVTADGSMPSMGELIYKIESAPLLLRVDEIHLTPKRGNDELIQLQASLSTVCKLNGQRPTTAATRANDVADAW